MNLNSYILCLVMVLAMSSCSSKRTVLPYFTDIDKVTVTETPGTAYMPVIQPDDELLISITSPNPENTAIYNLPNTNPAARGWIETGTGNIRPLTYIVDSKGNINLPTIGTLHVAGMTIEQLSADLLAKVRKDVLDASVNVEMVNFYVNVAGEVHRPSRQKVTSNRYSVLDAITEAGDLTPYGERENVLVIREVDGKKVYGRINLNSAEALNSPFYYLRQNDYVYVEPNNIRQSNAKYNQDNAFKLQVTSTIVSAASVIASLIIALTVK